MTATRGKRSVGCASFMMESIVHCVENRQNLGKCETRWGIAVGSKLCASALTEAIEHMKCWWVQSISDIENVTNVLRSTQQIGDFENSCDKGGPVFDR